MTKRRELEQNPCKDCVVKHKSIFGSLSDDDLDVLSSRKVTTLYKKGQTVFQEGNYPHGLYAIKSGKVKVSKMGEDGKEKILRLAGTGDIIGYRSLLSGESYNASTVAIEESKLCYMPSDCVEKVLEGSGKFGLRVLKLLADDLKSSEKMMVGMAYKTVQERIAESLLLLSEKFGYSDDENTIDVKLTRREIGEIAGVSTETAIRTLSDFNKEGIIAFQGKYIQVKQENKIRQIVNGYH